MADSVVTRRQALLGGVSLLTLAGCASTGFNFPGIDSGAPPDPSAPAPIQGQALGNGPVRVALLLPLSGDAATVGQSMANGATLAMEFIASNPKMTDNITLVIKDTGATSRGAAAAAQQAVAEGASLILGPLKADQVTAAGAVARSAGLSLIGFSNNSGAAQPGVYLLNVLPESEARRTLSYAKAQGRKAFAGLFPSNSFGQVQQAAFSQAASDLGLRVVATFNYGNETEARDAVTQLGTLLSGGQVDALMLPDRATAPSIAALVSQTGVAMNRLLLIGSADWNGDPAIAGSPYLTGAIYPAVDESGYQAILPQYQQRFGSVPHPFVTLAYTAVILANVSNLSMGSPRYDPAILTAPAGFNGRDGVFRFLSDGRSVYALTIKKLSAGGAAVVEGAKI